jgi:hypothetical protein
VFWLFLGPMALFVLAAAITQSGAGWATPLDVAFLVVAALILAARWYDLNSGEGRDVYGEPVTAAAFPKYAGWAIPTALAVWATANVLGNHILN